SLEFRLCLRPLQAVSGIPARGQRLPQKVSSHRRAKVAGFRVCGRLLRGAQASFQIQASLSVPVFLLLECSLEFARLLRKIRFLVHLLLASAAKICRSTALSDSSNQAATAAAMPIFQIVRPKNLFEPAKPPRRIAKIRRRVQTTF